MRRTFQQMALPLGIVAIPDASRGRDSPGHRGPRVRGGVACGRCATAVARGLRGIPILFELCYDFVVIAGNSRSLLAVQLLWLAGLVPMVRRRQPVRPRRAAAAQVLLAIAVIAPAYLVILRRLRVRDRVPRQLPVARTRSHCSSAVALGVQGSRASSMEVLAVVACAEALVVGGLAYRFRAEFGVWRRDNPVSPGSPRETSAGPGLPARDGDRGSQLNAIELAAAVRTAATTSWCCQTTDLWSTACTN